LRLQAVADIREAVDSSRDNDPSRLAAAVLVPMLYFIQRGAPVFQRHSQDQEIRAKVLELISRLMLSESSKERNPLVIDTMIHVARTDNEENGAAAIKIIIDVTRHFKICEERHATAFMHVVRDLYEQMEPAIAAVFSESEPFDPALINPSSRSFKVLGECPIAVVLLFQCHKEIVNGIVRSSLNAIVGVRDLPSLVNALLFTSCSVPRPSSTTTATLSRSGQSQSQTLGWSSACFAGQPVLSRFHHGTSQGKQSQLIYPL
jgi:transformation/transcription domain-associated protein